MKTYHLGKAFLAVVSIAKEPANVQGIPQNALFFTQRSDSDWCGDCLSPQNGT